MDESMSPRRAMGAHLEQKPVDVEYLLSVLGGEECVRPRLRKGNERQGYRISQTWEGLERTPQELRI